MKHSYLSMTVATLAAVLCFCCTGHARQLTIGLSEGTTGSVVTATVSIDDISGAASVFLKVNYDAKMLVLQQATNSPGALGDSFAYDYSDGQDGTVEMSLSREENMGSGSGPLVDLVFSIRDGVPPGESGEIVISDWGFGTAYGGDTDWSASVTISNGAAWVVMSDLVDSDGDGLSDYAEQMLDGSLEYSPGQTDTDAANPDSDGDGIEDGYEASNSLNPLLNDSALDLDEDGFINLYEWIAGTGANDSNDLFRALASNDVSVQEMVLQWKSVAGRTYDVLSKSNMTDLVWITNATGIVGDDTTKSYTNTSPNGVLFYRIQVTKP